jgi:hypothetical protein
MPSNTPFIKNATASSSENHFTIKFSIAFFSKVPTEAS